MLWRTRSDLKATARQRWQDYRRLLISLKLIFNRDSWPQRRLVTTKSWLTDWVAAKYLLSAPRVDWQWLPMSVPATESDLSWYKYWCLLPATGLQPFTSLALLAHSKQINTSHSYITLESLIYWSKWNGITWQERFESAPQTEFSYLDCWKISATSAH